MKCYVAMQDALLIAQLSPGNWHLNVVLDHLPTYCVAVDGSYAGRVYCGTFGEGLWYSDDEGETWRPVGDGITYKEITAVAVSRANTANSMGAVWAGTEPSSVFYSSDGGVSWVERPALLEIPSRDTWMFPPRPYTHHVRWIQPDIFEPERIFVGIEMGGVMRSLDQGASWEDRKPGSELDAHTLRMHPKTPGRLYETSGGDDPVFHQGGPLGEFVTLRSGGFAETRDGGVTWKTVTDGLEEHHYCWGLAVDPANPDILVASVARGAAHAHELPMAESYIYRRSAHTPWQRVHEGLPEPQGTLISELATNAAEPGVFYAANNRGIFRSVDTGLTWQRLPVEWPARFRYQHVQSLVVVS